MNIDIVLQMLFEDIKMNITVKVEIMKSIQNTKFITKWNNTLHKFSGKYILLYQRIETKNDYIVLSYKFINLKILYHILETIRNAELFMYKY